jgi:beta-galactosidase
MIETPLRIRHDISDGWEFVRGRVGRRWLQGGMGGGKTVDLPHCWNRGDTFQFGRRSYSGKGAYRRVIDLPETPPGPGRWHLRSEGFYGFGDLWLDGRAIARIDGHYLGFDNKLPEETSAGRHDLAVRLENLFQRRVLPGRSDPDFLLYGGLAGRVWLEWVSQLHIDTDRIEVFGRSGPYGAEILELRCGINGLRSSSQDCRMSWTVTHGDGAANEVEPGSVSEDVVSASTTILNPRCWSPDDPQLYWAEGRLETDVGTADVVRVRFGITRAEFRPDEGFFLDGRRVDLHGCNRHESIPGVGNALPEELHRADARLLKNYGCNFVRLSHYPQHPAFLDACDELGILVFAEIASWKSVSSKRPWRHAARRQMRDLILRDRHHPSVIVWGMGNESRSRKAYLELRDIARELDPARPVTYAENHLYRARREKTLDIPDVWSINYELKALDQAREVSRLRNVIVSECCNFPLSVRGDDGAELTQVATLEHEWKLLADRPYLAGHAVWCFADYATEHRKRYRRQPGLFDAWRQPKMAAELFRARYAKDPFISLFVTGVTDAGDLHVFTNCRRVRIIIDDTPPIDLDGELHSVVNLDRFFAVAKVEGTRGQATVREELRAWKEAATVAIGLDESEASPGRIVSVDLSIHDGAGNRVRNWDGHVVASVEGDAQLYTYTDAGEVLMSRGEGRVYLQLGRSGGEVVVRATADGFDPASITITPQR